MWFLIHKIIVKKAGLINQAPTKYNSDLIHKIIVKKGGFDESNPYNPFISIKIKPLRKINQIRTNN
jgi:hypothetical protein